VDVARPEFGGHAVTARVEDEEGVIADGLEVMGWSASEVGRDVIEGAAGVVPRRRPSKEIRAIGIDLGKSMFHLVAVDARGQVLERRSPAGSLIASRRAGSRPYCPVHGTLGAVDIEGPHHVAGWRFSVAASDR
jgi:hypothetical protein